MYIDHNLAADYSYSDLKTVQYTVEQKFFKNSSNRIFLLIAKLCLLYLSVDIQGDPKRMYDSVLKLKSVPEVRFYFPACVLDSEFRA